MDIRIIKIVGSEVILTDQHLNEPLDYFDTIVQRVVIALLMTPGSMIDAPDWGGGGSSFLLSIKKEADLKFRISEIFRKTSESLLPDPDIDSIRYVSHSRLDKGIKINFIVELNDGTALELGLINGK